MNTVHSDNALGVHTPEIVTPSEEELKAKRRDTFLDRCHNPLDYESESYVRSVLTNTQGEKLIAPGYMYWVYGEPGTRKTWLGLKLLSECRTLYIDLESEPWTVGERLRLMNLKHNQSEYFYTPATREEFKANIKAIAELDIDAVVFDSASGLFNNCGFNTNDDQDVATIFGEVLKPIRSSGKAVFVIDHIAKNAGNKDFPFGSQTKKSQSDVCWYLKVNEQTGDIEIQVTKDRPGLYMDLMNQMDKMLGVIKIENSPLEVNIYPYDPFEIYKEDKIAQERQDRATILDAVRRKPGMLYGEVSDIRGLASGRKTKIRDQLIEAGEIVVRKVPRENSGGLQNRLYAHDYEE